MSSTSIFLYELWTLVLSISTLELRCINYKDAVLTLTRDQGCVYVSLGIGDVFLKVLIYCLSRSWTFVLSMLQTS
jgi:hypothetical protein